MDSPAPSSRRKACDLCFSKKIKCDMLKPKCSNCVLYESACLTTAVRRKKDGRDSGRVTKPGGESSTPESVDERLARIERQLQAVLEATKNMGQASSSEGSNTTSDENDCVACAPGTSSQAWAFDDLAAPALPLGSSSDPMSLSSTGSCLRLPPLEQILPAVNTYFADFNSAIPLFEQESFMAMLHCWYFPLGAEQSTPAWAAIQIVIALSQLVTVARINTAESDAADQRIGAVLAAVKGVVPELTTREEDLLGLQAVLGLIFLYQGTTDQKPASVLIGAAIRLAHRMELHCRDGSRTFDPATERQRSRLFWIAYTLDKDISLRSKMPSFQVDADIDVPLPDQNPDDGLGIMLSRDCSTRFNFFRHTVDLSHIEGKIYDCLYSVRSRKVSAEERQARTQRLERMLETWQNSIPAPFQMENAVEATTQISLLHLNKLYHSFLLAYVMLEGIFTHDSGWVQRLASPRQDNGVMEVRASTAMGLLPLPAGWGRCIEISRLSLGLFAAAPHTSWLVWSNSCMQFSGLIMILVNMFAFPDSEFGETDGEMAARSLRLFNTMVLLRGGEVLHKLRGLLQTLHSGALAMIEKRHQSLSFRDSMLDSVAALGADAITHRSFELPTNWASYV